MSNKDNSGPAFPVTPENYDQSGYCGEGMTIRDYFAAKAMQGMIINGGYDYEETESNSTARSRLVAADAYRYADAMIAERDK